MNLSNIEQEIPEVQLEEKTSKLDAKDFACRSKAKAKPQRRELADSSRRTVPIEKRTWTDVEPRKYLFSDFEVSKKLMHLLRHGQHVHREDYGAVQFWTIKEIIQKYSHIVLIGLIASGTKAWQEEEEEETRKDFNTVLTSQDKKFVTFELFKDIQEAILLILRHRTT